MRFNRNPLRQARNPNSQLPVSDDKVREIVKNLGIYQPSQELEATIRVVGAVIEDLPTNEEVQGQIENALEEVTVEVEEVKNQVGSNTSAIISLNGDLEETKQSVVDTQSDLEVYKAITNGDINAIRADTISNTNEIDLLKNSQSSGQVGFTTWAELSATTGTSTGALAQVIGDSGTHTDAISGDVVPNSGQYRWTGIVWQWIREDSLDAKADKSVVDPMVPVVNYLSSTIINKSLPGYALNVMSPHPSKVNTMVAAGGVRDDGTNVWNSGEYTRLKVYDPIDGTTKAYPKNKTLLGYCQNFFDKNWKACGGILDDGTLHFKNVKFESINDTPISDIIGTTGAEAPNFNAEVNMVWLNGQSLAESLAPAITLVQEYDTVGFPAHAVSPTSWSPATAETTSFGGTREIPTLAATDNIKELILNENGIAYNQQSYQLLISNTAYAGFTIAQLEKGTASYSQWLSQVNSALSIAQSQNKTFGVDAIHWVQGEGDYTRTQDYYASRLSALQSDATADARAVTGQQYPVILVASQTTSWGPTDYSRSVQLAMVQAQKENKNIVLSAPQYMYSYVDDTFFAHVISAHARLIGAYQGLAHKRTIIDGKKWEPLLPVSAKKQGKIIYLKFNKTGIQLDTTLVPAQPNYGISLRGKDGTEYAVSSVSISQPNVVKIVAAAEVPNNTELWLGGKVSTGIANYHGGATNIRDNQGDYLSFDNYPLHNWAVISKIEVL